MAKLRRYRRYYRRSGRWAANIQEINALLDATPGTFSRVETLVLNEIQLPTKTSQTYTVKNIEITFNISTEAINYEEDTVYNLEGITAYIMYVPQGMNITNNYNTQHPEYILAYKYIGSPNTELNQGGSAGNAQMSIGQQYQPIKVRSRLARKLQTGDNIVLFIKGINQSTSETINFRVNGLVRWWTKAN